MTPPNTPTPEGIAAGLTKADSMIERVARELCAQEGGDPDRICHGEGKSADKTYSEWRAYTSNARAVLTAMREPTEGMHDAGVAVTENQSIAHDKPLPTLRNCYRAMIDAALAEASIHG